MLAVCMDEEGGFDTFPIEVVQGDGFKEILHSYTAVPEKEVLQYFESIDKYALQDLQKMLECANYNSSHERLAVPIAQSCFSLLDIMGFLLRDFSGKDPQGELKNSMGNINCSLAYFFKNEISQIDRNVLVQLYRHGNMHSFLPKYAGIHNTVGSQDILLKQNGVFNLNVHPLSKILIDKLRLLFANFSTNDRRETILLNFSIYQSDLQKSYRKFSNQLTNTTSSTNTTTVYKPR